MRSHLDVQDLLDHLQSEFVTRSNIDRETRSVLETLKFLWLVSSGNNCAHRLISEMVDDTWHDFIIDTRFYDHLCLSLPGRFFIHHEPFGLKSLPSDAESAQCILALSEYVQLFGSFTTESLVFWPAVQELANTFGLSLDEFNARLASLPPSRKNLPDRLDRSSSFAYAYQGTITAYQAGET